MASRWPLLLPLFAAGIVAAAGALVLALGDSGPDSRPIAPVATAAPTEQPPAETPAARTRPGGTVCQGTMARPAPGTPRAFNAIYTQRREAAGITIVAGAKVDERALDIAEKTIERVFARNNLEQPLIEQGAYVIVAEAGQDVLELPEFSCLRGQVNEDFFSHVCGVADRADYPVATVNELDLTGNRNGPCRGLNVLYHELGHLVQGWTLDHADYIDIRILYQAALDAGKYRGEYASTNTNEYFADGTQAYFLASDTNGRRDRAWLKGYDPDLYALLDRIYDD